MFKYKFDIYCQKNYFLDFEKFLKEETIPTLDDPKQLVEGCKLIIERGYRIWYSDEMKENEKNTSFTKLSEDNIHVLRVKQVFDYLEHIVSNKQANKKTEYSIKTPEQYRDDKSLNLV